MKLPSNDHIYRRRQRRRAWWWPLLLLSLSSGAAADDGAPTFIDEIVVVGSKTERPLTSVAGQVTVIDRIRLDREQVRDLGAIARYEPALSADARTPRFGSTGLSIRGIGGNRVALEFDGVPLPGQFDVGNFADSGRLALDPAIVSRIEILRGPASVLYGSDAIGGVIVITSVDPQELVAPGRSVHIGAGSGYFGAVDGLLMRATSAWADETDGALLSVVHRRGAQPDNRARGVADDLLDSTQWQVFTKWTRETESAGSLRLSADYFLREIDSDLRALLGYERFANTRQLRGDDEQRRGRLTMEYSLPPLAWLDESSLRFYYQENRTEQRTSETRTSPTGVLDLARDFYLRENGYGAELRLRREFQTGALAHVSVAGVEWDRQRLTQRRDGSQTNQTTGVVSNSLLGEEFPLRDLPLTNNDEIGLYLQDEIAYGRLTLIPGARWDAFRLDSMADSLVPNPDRLTDLHNDHVSLRFGATYRVVDPLSLFVSYAEGFRAPPAEDVNLLLDLPLLGVRSLPNPDLKPEESRNVEVGLRWRDEGRSFTAGFYHASYDDFIERRVPIGMDPQSGLLLFQSRNLEEATIYGFEADGRLDLGHASERLEAWQVDAGVHWAHGDNDVTGQPLNSVAPLKAVGGLRRTFASLRADAELRVTHLAKPSRVDTSTAEVFVPPSATVLDILARWEPSDWADVQLGIHNLTHERYWAFDDVRRFAPTDPRIEIASQSGIHVNLSFNVRY